ncbi:MAG: glycine zipper 2TM domain-containing protein [Proteobacteria bacterium]|nr:glycine zipper 2TM domain-containing protein [Pseudomonadota bacterium]
MAQTPTAAPATASEENSHFGWADVLRVDPVYATDATDGPAQPCYDEQVPVDASPDAAAQDKRGVFTAIGAFVGGILGNQFGKGKGRAVATVAGAVAGGVAGSNIATAGEGDAGRPQYKTVRHCPPSASSQRKVVAYDVEYRYRGDVYRSRLAYDPGDRLRVRVSVTPAE